MNQEKAVNGYKIRFNPLWNEWQVSHPEIGPCGEFETEAEAIEHARKG